MQHNDLIKKIYETSTGDLAALPIDKLADLQSKIETLIAQADNVRKWLNGALMLKYSPLINEKRDRLQQPYGEIKLHDEGYEIIEDRPMLLTWDEQKLREYAARITANGANPEDYMDISYTVSEQKYNSLSSEVRKILNEAGNIRQARSSILIVKLGED